MTPRPSDSRLGRRLATTLIVAVTLAFPFAVHFGLRQADPRWFAVALITLALLRAWFAAQRFWWWAALGAGLLGALSLAGQGWLPLKLYPVVVNATLLGVFGASLWRGPPVVERLARLSEPDLPPAGVRYTRRVTQVWCGFFVLNGGLALHSALYWSSAAWALYNGLIAYLLIGALLGGEWLLRQVLKSRARRAPEAPVREVGLG